MTKISNQYSLTNVLFADAVNGRVGIGTTSPLYPLESAKDITYSDNIVNGDAQFSVAGLTTRTKRMTFGYDTNSANGFGYIKTGNQGVAYTPLYLNPASAGAGGVAIGYAPSVATPPSSGLLVQGNVGIGTSSPSAILHVNGGALPMVVASTSATELYCEYRYNTTSVLGYIGNGAGIILSGGSSTDFGIRAQSNLVFTSGGGTERMRITAGGQVCVNTTTASFVSTNRGNVTVGGSSGAIYTLQTGGIDRAYVYHDGSNYSINSVNAGGNIYMSSVSGGVIMSANATSWASNSDERLKNINSNIEDAVSRLSSLRAVNFSWKSDETQKEVLGLIAQDVEKVFPQVIDKNKLPAGINGEQLDKTEYLSVRYTELIPVLVKAIQELSAQASEQQTQINELKALLNA